MKRICMFIGLFWASIASAQFTISGTVYGEGLPLDGATLILSGPQSRNSVSANGSILIQGIKAGTYRLLVSHTSHYSLDTTLTIPCKNLVINLLPYANTLGGVEVKALRAAATAPFAKTDLSKAAIEKDNLGYDIPFMLNQVPGTVINSDAGNGVGYTGIRIRGSDASRINVTLNGVPYNDAENQGTFFVNLPDLLSSVSSIQVQRGVGTSSNGPGAFGGGISLSTSDYNPVAYAELNNSFGSFNTFKHTLKLGSGLIGKKFTVDARLSRIGSDGYMDRAASNLKGAYFNAAYWGKNSSLRFVAMLGKEKTYQAWNGVTDADLLTNRTVNTAGTEKPGTPYDNETDNYWQNHYQLIYTRQKSSNVIFNSTLYLSTGKGYYEQYKASKKLADYGLAPLVVNGVVVSRTDLVRRLWLNNKLFGQTLSLQMQKGRNHLTLGGNWSVYPGQHYGEIVWTAAAPTLHHRWYDLDAKKTDISSYAKWDRKLNANWHLFADLQYRFVNYHLNGFRDNPAIRIANQYHFFNPKAGLSYQKKDWSGFLSYAMANKEPNRDDFEAGTAQQPKPEQLHDVELNMQRKNIVKGLTAGLTLYGMFYNNQLVLTGKINDVGAYTRTNLPKSYRLGAEFETRYQFAKGSLRYSLALSRNRIKNFTEFIDDYDNGGQIATPMGNTPISYSPAVVQYLAFGYQPFTNFNAEVISKYVSRQYLDNTGNASRSLSAYTTTDLHTSYRLPFKKTLKEINLVLQANNLFGSLYEPNGYSFSYFYGGQISTENYYFPMAGLNFMAAINIKL